MDILKLKAFLAVTKHGSFSKAAEEFTYTPSAFSHIADSLEQELGVKLFIRTHKGVSLTAQGIALKQKIEQVVLAQEQLLSAVEQFKINDQIKISTYSSVSLYELPKIIKDFKALYPNVKFSINVVDNLKVDIENNGADVYFGDVRAFEDKLEYFPIIQDEFVAVVPNNEFKGKKQVAKEELYDFAYIKTNESLISENLEEERFKEIFNYTSVEDFSVFKLVGQGIGVTVTNSLVAKNHVKGAKVLKIVPTISRTIGVGYKKSKNQSPNLSAFIKFVKKAYSK